jgi:hypothetical protein
MSNGIPIDDSAAMAGNLVKAVEDIAVAVGSASDVFGRSFGEFAVQFKTSMSGVTDSVKTLQNEMVDVIKSLDVSIKVIKNIKMPPVAVAKPPKPAAAVKEQDPVLQKAKQDMALNSLAISEIKLKSAREKQAFDIQKKITIQQNADAKALAKEQKEKVAKEKKQALLPVPEIIKAISDPMQAIADGVGHFFDMAEKRAMATVAQGLSGEQKKGKKEKPFSMDMDLLATANKPAGPGVDIPKNLLTGLTDSAAAWNDVFANATRLSQEMATRFSIIGTTQPRQTEQFDPGTTYRQNVLLYEVLDRPRNQEEETQNQEYNAGEIYSVLGNIGNLQIENQTQVASLMEDVRSMLGDATDQAQALALEIQAALDPRTYVEQAQDAIDGLGESLSQQAVEVTSVLENLFYDIAEASSASQSVASRTVPTSGQMYQGGYSAIGIAQNYVPPSAAPQAYQLSLIHI